MKKLFYVILFAVFMIANTQAQFTTDAKIVSSKSHAYVEFVGSCGIDGTTYDSLRSKSFTLRDFDAVSKLTFYRHFDCDSSTAGRMQVLLQRSEDNSTWTLMTTDTIATADTLETRRWTGITNFSDPVSSYYRLIVMQMPAASGGTAGTKGTTSFTIRFIAAKRDFELQ